MANYKINGSVIKRVANAVRRVIGSSNALTFADIATALENTSIVQTSSANATASDIKSGKTAYVNGTKISGTLTVQANKTVAPKLNQTQTIVPDSGYSYLSSVEVQGITCTRTANSSGGTVIQIM